MLKNRLFGELASLIEENGGKLVPLDDKNLSWNQMMTLLSDDDPMVEEFKDKDRLLFHCRFVTESCEDKVLKNPMIYRFVGFTHLQECNRTVQLLYNLDS